MDDLVQVMVWVVALGPVDLDSWGPLVLKGIGILGCTPNHQPKPTTLTIS